MYSVRIVAVILACKSGLPEAWFCVAGENQRPRTFGVCPSFSLIRWSSQDWFAPTDKIDLGGRLQQPHNFHTKPQITNDSNIHKS